MRKSCDFYILKIQEAVKQENSTKHFDGKNTIARTLSLKCLWLSHEKDQIWDYCKVKYG